MNNKISHEDFLTIINEERYYWQLKESITMKSQRSHTGKIILVGKGKENVHWGSY